MAQRFEGRNLEEALNAAAGTFAVERWQLTYHVLMEKRGFLGGVKRVVIEAEVNQDAPPPTASPAHTSPAPPAPLAPGDDRRPPRREPKAEAGARPPRRDGGREGGRDRGRGGARGRSRGGERGGRGRRQESDLEPGDFEKFLAADAPPQGEESAEAKAVRGWCEEIIELGRFALDIRTEEREEQILVRFYGDDVSRLVDRHGELLDAMQVLANKALVGRAVQKEIEFDAEQFKERRAEDLAVRARAAADRVRSERREELLPAMTPIERRIVHLALRDDADVTTESRGEGFYKRVAIILRTEAAAPLPQTEP